MNWKKNENHMQNENDKRMSETIRQKTIEIKEIRQFLCEHKII